MSQTLSLPPEVTSLAMPDQTVPKYLLLAWSSACDTAQRYVELLLAAFARQCFSEVCAVQCFFNYIVV